MVPEEGTLACARTAHKHNDLNRILLRKHNRTGIGPVIDLQEDRGLERPHERPRRLAKEELLGRSERHADIGRHIAVGARKVSPDFASVGAAGCVADEDTGREVHVGREEGVVGEQRVPHACAWFAVDVVLRGGVEGQGKIECGQEGGRFCLEVG